MLPIFRKSSKSMHLWRQRLEAQVIFCNMDKTVLLLGVNEQDCDRILSILDPEADWKGTEHGFPFHEEVSIFVTDVNDYVKVNA